MQASANNENANELKEAQNFPKKITNLVESIALDLFEYSQDTHQDM